jgi:hypothetical protein
MPNPIPSNATYLFEANRKSEQWWTAFFSIAAVAIGKTSNPNLPLYCFKTNPEGWRFESCGNLALSGLELQNVHVEATLQDLLFRRKHQLDISLFGFKPDIVINNLLDPNDRIIRIIEDKTIGTGPGALLDYVRAATELTHLGYEATVILLISCGNSNKGIWKTVTIAEGISIMLWEDILPRIGDISGLRELFDDLGAYSAFEREGKWQQGEWEQWQRM